MNVANYLKTRSVGYWFSAAVIILSLVTAIVYAVSYGGTENINWASFAMLLVAAVGGTALMCLKQAKYAPYLLALFVFIALLLFADGIYFYVSVVMVGIDIQDGFSSEFLACAILFILTLGLGIADIFLAQSKPVKTTEEAEDEKVEA